MSPLIRVAAALAAGGAIFFLGQLLRTLMTRRGLSKIERSYMIREEERRRGGGSGSLRQQARDRALNRGYDSSLGALAGVLGLLFLVCVLGMQILGLPGAVPFLIALPMTVMVVWIAGIRGEARRRAQFDRQMLTALDLVADQLAAGFAPQRAFETVVATIDDPFHTAMGAVLSSAAANRDLTGEMRLLAHRYPSRAFDLLIAALEINEQLGGRLEPSLRQSASILRSGFALAEEAKAEVSQARSEYYGILAVLGLITAVIYTSNAEVVNNSLATPIGLLLIGGAFAWACVGVFLIQRMFASIGSQK